MPYVPQQVPGFLQDFDALRKWTEEEFQRLSSAYAEDELVDATNLTAVQADITTLQTDVGGLQTDVGVIQAQILQANDLISGSGSAALTTNTPAQVATIPVLSGTWDIEASLQFTGAAATNVTNARGSIDLTTATMNTTLPDSMHWRNTTPATDAFIPLFLGRKRVVLGSTTNYFLNALAIFTVSNYSAAGIITARRIIV